MRQDDCNEAWEAGHAAAKAASSENLLTALRLALKMLAPHEPGDSRGVSNEFVALAAIAVGGDSPAVMKIITEALNSPQISPKDAEIIRVSSRDRI